jgi:RNA polymerase sigma-70 factor (ECF subfamily)
MDERSAVERLKRGDVGGLEILVRQHYTHAVRAADLILRERALAEDVVQSAFVRAYERIDQFDAERSFVPWFMKIVINDAVKTASRRERTASFYRGDTEDLLVRLTDPGKGPHEQAEEAETRQRIWEALEQLPPVQRAVIVQRYYLGMSETEMAESGASPPGTIKSRLNAARKSLSKLLRPQFRAEAPAPAGVSTGTSERRNDND